MSSPTWAEYLAGASAHLAAARRSAEVGAPPPAPPERPHGPVPEDRRAEAQRLAAGYDQLATEVVTRLSIIEERRLSTVRRNPHQEPRPARYIDTPV
jgi:hypothetical protein